MDEGKIGKPTKQSPSGCGRLMVTIAALLMSLGSYVSAWAGDADVKETFVTDVGTQIKVYEDGEVACFDRNDRPSVGPDCLKSLEAARNNAARLAAEKAEREAKEAQERVERDAREAREQAERERIEANRVAQIESLRKEAARKKSADLFLKAYSLSEDDDDLRNASRVATTKAQKSEIEKTLVMNSSNPIAFFSASKPIVAGSRKSGKSGADILVLDGSGNVADVDIEYEINGDRSLLKYGAYEIATSLAITVHYETIYHGAMGFLAIFGASVSGQDSNVMPDKKYDARANVVLSSSNKYSGIAKVRLKDIVAGMNMGAFGGKMAEVRISKIDFDVRLLSVK